MTIEFLDREPTCPLSNKIVMIQYLRGSYPSSPLKKSQNIALSVIVQILDFMIDLINRTKNRFLSPKSINKNFGLTSKEFDLLVDRMRCSDNTLLEHIYQVHYKYCRDYLRERYSIDEEIAYDLFMDALIIFRTKVLNKKIVYGNLTFLYTRLTINSYMDYHRNKKRLNEALVNFAHQINQPTQVIEDSYVEILESCLVKLKAKDTLLLRQLFLDKISGEELATQLGVKYAALRRRKKRAIDRLRDLIIDELKNKNHVRKS